MTLKRTLLLGVAVATFGGAGGKLDAQQEQSLPSARFVVASIRPTSLPAQYSWRVLPGRFIATAVPLERLIARAYGVPEWRIVDEPKWVKETYFDVQATSEGSAMEQQM